MRQLLFSDKGVLSIASKSIHMSLRRGLAQWNITHEKMTDLRCMSYTSKGASEILVAGLQNSMFTIDVDKGRVTREVRVCTRFAACLAKSCRYPPKMATPS